MCRHTTPLPERAKRTVNETLWVVRCSALSVTVRTPLQLYCWPPLAESATRLTSNVGPTPVVSCVAKPVLVKLGPAAPHEMRHAPVHGARSHASWPAARVTVPAPTSALGVAVGAPNLGADGARTCSIT